MTPLPWAWDDGGRAAAGYKGEAADCACRAIAIAAGLDYQQAYDLINLAATGERPRAGQKRSSARDWVNTLLMRGIMTTALGWEWHPTMFLGTGCRVRLAAGELPDGRLIVRLSRHYAAVVGGVVRDTHDPGRGGTRCIYGFWTGPLIRM